jgi:4-hydroxy-tetrahydrodipicolinate synthase
MNRIENLTGSIVALVTPFNQNKEIDFTALENLINFHIENGTDAILINGTTGEGATLNLTEYRQLIQFVVHKTAKRLPVIVGSGSNDTAKAVQQSQIAQKLGADGLLVINPYYNKPSNQGMYNYFRELASETDLPIILYNVPGRTGTNMNAALTLRLAQEIENIVGIKEASGDLGQIMEIIKNRPEGFKVYSGDDALALPIVNLGGDGCISVVANQIPGPFRTMLNAALTGNQTLAKKLHYQYLNLMNLNFIESNPIPVKTSLSLMGFIKNNYRSPMCPMEDPLNFAKLRKELEHLCLIEESVLA